MTEDQHQTVKAALSYLAANMFNDDIGLPLTVAVPEGVEIKSIEQFSATPLSIRSSYVFKDYASFLSYFREHVSEVTRLFYNEQNGLRFKAVFDHHTKTQPRWGKHEALYVIEYHEEYARLVEHSGRAFTQLAFAEFVEDNLPLFLAPDGATMLEIAQELKGARKAEFKAGKRLADGRVNFQFQEELQARTVNGEVAIPEDITFTCSIYEGEAPIEIPAKFRWRLSEDGKIAFSYKLMTDRIERSARRDIVHRAADDTGLLPLHVAK